MIKNLLKTIKKNNFINKLNNYKFNGKNKFEYMKDNKINFNFNFLKKNIIIDPLIKNKILDEYKKVELQFFKKDSNLPVIDSNFIKENAKIYIEVLNEKEKTTSKIRHFLISYPIFSLSSIYMLSNTFMTSFNNNIVLNVIFTSFTLSLPILYFTPSYLLKYYSYNNKCSINHCFLVNFIFLFYLSCNYMNILFIFDGYISLYWFKKNVFLFSSLFIFIFSFLSYPYKKFRSLTYIFKYDKNEYYRNIIIKDFIDRSNGNIILSNLKQDNKYIIDILEHLYLCNEHKILRNFIINNRSIFQHILDSDNVNKYKNNLKLFEHIIKNLKDSK